MVPDPTGLEARILDTIAAPGPLHVMEVAARLAADPVRVDLACARLADRRQLHLLGGGRYGLPDWPTDPTDPDPATRQR